MGLISTQQPVTSSANPVTIPSPGSSFIKKLTTAAMQISGVRPSLPRGVPIDPSQPESKSGVQGPRNDTSLH